LPDVLAWDGLLGRSIEAVETNALARRPELLALAAEIELLERKVEAHAPRVMPPLDVSLQVSLVGEGRRMSDTFDRYEPRIGIGFGMALDQGRRPDFERRRLALRHASAVQARTALEDRVRVEARDAALLLEERLGELAFAREANALADDEYRSIELRHRAGRVTTEQALEAAETHAAARHRELEARISYWVAKHRLDVFAGTDLGWSASAYAAADEWAIPN
jgi:outer membrane protein TolC